MLNKLLLLFFSLALLISSIGMCTEDDFILPKNPIVTIQTNYGPVEVLLFTEDAPKACENFLRLAAAGFYNDTPFHRVIPEFMIQGGDPTGVGNGGQSIWGVPFEDEISEELSFNIPGRLAMANAGPNTNQSQFFITTVSTPWLDKKHTIFGQVIKGYETLKKIESKGSPSGSIKPWFWQSDILQPAIVSISLP